MSAKSLIIMIAALVGTFALLGAQDLIPSGTVLSVTGPDAVRPGEILRGVTIGFSRVTAEHAVTVRWVDSKGRICGLHEETIKPPAAALTVAFDTTAAIGNNHRIEVLVDGVLQGVSHPFHVVPPAGPWDDYQAIVWADYDTAWAGMMRQIGLTGMIWRGNKTTDPDFAFYPDNIAYEVFAYYHKRRTEHDVMKKAWAANPEDRVLHHRRPSLTDESTWVTLKERLLPVVEECRDYRPLYYNVADEIGIADQSAVSDLDWEYSSRTAWRNWLEKKYGTLDALNAEWGTACPTWGNVRAFFPTTHYMYDQLWRDNLLPAAFGTVDRFNTEFDTSYDSFAAVAAGYKNIRSDNEAMSPAGLEARFKTVEALNGKLGTAFASLADAAAYVQKYEAWLAGRNAADTRGWNLAWWCDFRDYMEDYMAGGLARARAIGREADPDGRFGITGTHHPGVFNGHNYAKLVKSIDAIIPYNIGQSFELIRGFAPGLPVMHPTWRTGRELKRDLWYHFLQGCRGVLFWDNHEENNKLIDREAGTIASRGEAAQPVLNELTTGIGRLLIGGRRDHSGIAIYHSQASVRVDWFQRNIGLGRHYIERMSWDEYRQCEPSVLRTSWIKLIEDNALQFIFVSPEQVAEGRLDRENIRVLILPEVWALSDDEAACIRAFARAGGMVIADQYTGLYDGHGRRRAAGVLDDLFRIDQSGIRGDGRTKAGRPEMILPDNAVLADILTGRRNPVPVGKGNAILLGMDVSHYSRIRQKDTALAERMAEAVRLILPPELAPLVWAENRATGRTQHGAEVGVWHLGPDRMIAAVWRNYQINKEGIGGEAYTDNTLFEQAEQVTVRFGRPFHVFNQRTGAGCGLTDAVDLELDPWEPVILTLQAADYDETPVILDGALSAVRGGEIAFTIAAQDAADTLQVFHVTATAPNGDKPWYYSRNVSTMNNRAVYRMPLALNDQPGAWTFTVRDAAIQQTIEFTVNVK